MVDLPRLFRTSGSGRAGTAGPHAAKVAIVEGAIGGEARFASIAALFPHVQFASAGPVWPDRTDAHLDILIVAVDAGRADEIDTALRRLATDHGSTQIVIVLRDADVMVTRQLLRAGAADVLPAPLSEPTLAIALERLLGGAAAAAGRRRKGEVVAFLKAGGGVGATSLCVQTGAMLAAKGQGRVCIADLDLQFGSAGLYLDMPEAVSVTDCPAAGPGLAETPYATALGAHRTGVQLLSAPRRSFPSKPWARTRRTA